MIRPVLVHGPSFLLARFIGVIALACGPAALQAQTYSFTTLAGMAESPASYADGTGSAARFNMPTGVAVDRAGNVYISEYYNHTIRKITSGGVVTTIAGSAGTSGSADGTGTAARFYNPTGVPVDSTGSLYIADNANSTIRKITSGGEVTTWLGTARSEGSADGTGRAAQFNYPYGVAVDGAGNLYITDFYNRTLRKSTSAGAVTTLAGLAGNAGTADGTGNAARFFLPNGAAVDATGNVYVSDEGSHTIRKITSGGVVTTLAGLANNFGTADGTGSTARFSFPTGGIPHGVAVDGAGNVYVADTGNHTIRKITSAGVVTTLGGLAGTPGSADGIGSAARFFNPAGLAVDTAGILYVADLYNNTIRRGVPAGIQPPTTNPTSSLTNLSVRTTMVSGQTLIVGAVVSGGTKNILIRAAGPALNKFSLVGMSDPRLELYTTGAAPTTTNDDWPASLASTFASVGAFAFDSGSRDAALSQSLNGSFTVQARGTGPGTVLVEAYDVSGGVSPRLINLSARNRVGTGSDVLVAGFVLAGTGSKQVLIRAVGPGLAAFNVQGTLADPLLQVYNSASVVIATNDNWDPGLSSTFTQAGAFSIPAGSRDAALLVTLTAGVSYTAVVSGVNGGTGEALVEVYEIF